jgi:addiction module HigA family antidote
MDEPEFEERKQTEIADNLRCWTEGTEYGRGKIFFTGERFPSLLHWTFGLIGREGVPARQLYALANQIQELCDSQVAHFDYQPVDLPFYETDKWGLAILDEYDGLAFEPVDTGPKTPMLPGRWLRAGWMYSGITSDKLADALGVPPLRVEDILEGRCPIDPEMALRLARYFGNEPTYWLDLQARYDLALEQQAKGDEIERTVQPKVRGA